MAGAQQKRIGYNGVPTRNRQEQIRLLIEEALESGLELYSIRQMARDKELSDQEVEWADEHIYFVAKIER